MYKITHNPSENNQDEYIYTVTKFIPNSDELKIIHYTFIEDHHRQLIYPQKTNVNYSHFKYFPNWSQAHDLPYPVVYETNFNQGSIHINVNDKQVASIPKTQFLKEWLQNHLLLDLIASVTELDYKLQEAAIWESLSHRLLQKFPRFMSNPDRIDIYWPRYLELSLCPIFSYLRHSPH
jgi:hypothetical protein